MHACCCINYRALDCCTALCPRGIFDLIFQLAYNCGTFRLVYFIQCPSWPQHASQQKSYLLCDCCRSRVRQNASLKMKMRDSVQSSRTSQQVQFAQVTRYVGALQLKAMLGILTYAKGFCYLPWTECIGSHSWLACSMKWPQLTASSRA